MAPPFPWLQFIIMVLLGLAVLVAYVYTLIKQAKKSQWAWFVVTLIFPVTMLVYWIAKALGGTD